jgi:thiamine biosynthesis lipoprotein
MDGDNRAIFDRRDFIRRLGVMGFGLAVGAPILRADTAALPAGPPRVSETRRRLGTRLQITLIHPSRERSRRVIEACFREVDRLDPILNRHRAGTAVSRLNREGHLDDAPAVLRLILRRAIERCASTGGLFDVTVEPVITLCRTHFERYRTPPPETDLLALLPRVGSGMIRLEGARVAFERPGMGITLDGIAKGYIVDRVAEIARDAGIEHALVDAGGDIRAVGGREDGSPWRIAVQSPFREDGSIDTIALSDGAVASSGNYRAYYDAGKVFHHIVDPRSGHSPAGCAGTTVRAASAMEADALSTALFVMDPDETLRFAGSRPGMEALIVTRTGKTMKTAGWSSSG